MQSKFINHPQNTFLEVSSADSMQLTCNKSIRQQQTFVFAVSFQGRMDMYSDIDTVAEYLNAHEGWFCRCAQPMKASPLNENGYILTVGKYGSFGYEVEPKIGIVLNPPIAGVYRMHTIPIPNYDPAGYEVNYSALMKLEEVSLDPAQTATKGVFSPPKIPARITQVSWELDLTVEVEFPEFMTKFSSGLIQVTGDRLLAQIVRQISPRLTYKVQQDFHRSHNLPLPLLINL